MTSENDPMDASDESPTTVSAPLEDGNGGDHTAEQHPPARGNVTPPSPQPRSSRSLAAVAIKIVTFVGALFLFILALQLMKTGAKSVGPEIRGSFVFGNGVSTLGLGWLSAYVVLSGSPVAATSLTLFKGDLLTPLQTFTMLSGSRLGASFIVLLTGFLYAVRNRGHNRHESIGMGVLALSLTAIVYLPGMLLGYWFLRSGLLDGINWHASEDLLGVVDYVWGPVETFLYDLVPNDLWLMLPIGLGILLVSFKLLDHVLPQVSGDHQAQRRSDWLKKPWPMFLLGCLVATLTLSVSVALTVLVPLASKGYVKRKEAIPYIMGANITTLADTLVAAMLLGSAVAVRIVLAEAIGVSIVTLFYLAVLYKPVSTGIMRFDDWVVDANTRLWVFVGVLFFMPVLLLCTGFFS